VTYFYRVIKLGLYLLLIDAAFLYKIHHFFDLGYFGRVNFWGYLFAGDVCVIFVVDVPEAIVKCIDVLFVWEPVF
jgi:hypothetical protein